jgi:GT2 family glycosyltransferase
VIVYGTAISDREVYERVALPGIERVAGGDALVIERSGFDSVFEPYNEMLAEAAEIDDLDALVLLHQDLALTDDSLPRRLAPLLADRRVGVVGALGLRDVNLRRWTESRDSLFGTAMAPGVEQRFTTGPHDVEVVDGSLLAIAPWAVRSLRFTQVLEGTFHGYDVDFCCRVRAAGGRVVCDDIPYFHDMRNSWDGDEVLGRVGAELARRWDP